MTARAVFIPMPKELHYDSPIDNLPRSSAVFAAILLPQSLGQAFFLNDFDAHVEHQESKNYS